MDDNLPWLCRKANSTQYESLNSKHEFTILWVGRSEALLLTKPLAFLAIYDKAGETFLFRRLFASCLRL